MAKRLQVILQDPEYREIQRVARSRRMSIAEWVRQALASARRKESSKSLEKKLEVVRAAVKYEFPAGDIDEMLKEIEDGYLSGEHP
jgi:CRISPR/Cas system-associated protein Cas7 (RAMP superfamily)